MSQGLGYSRAAGPPINNPNRISSPQASRTLPPVQDDRQADISRTSGYVPALSNVVPTSQSMEHPNGPTSRSTGPVGMQNLLNPSGQNTPTDTSRRRSADHFNPIPGPTTPQLPPPLLSQSSNNKPLPSITPPLTGTYPLLAGQPRRILTPRAPLHSAQSASTGIPSATIDAIKSPFIGARDQANVNLTQSHSQPTAPQGPALPESTHSVPASFNRSPPPGRPSTGSLQLQNLRERRVSTGALSQPPGSQSNSPSTSYSSYSRFSNTPPAPHAVVATSQPSSFFAPHNGKGATGPAASRNADRKEAFGSVASSMGHGAMQLMTLDTEQGPIQVPVDVTAASKVADEKRKRNATASHRFRQRRKEKERETSNNIAKLEHQIHELAKERDYYRLERDYFRNVAVCELGQIRLPPRPPSPRQARLAPQTVENGLLREGQWSGQDEHSNHGRNTRRRTSTYIPATGDVIPVNAGPPPQRYGSVTSNPSGSAEQRAAPESRAPVPGLQMNNGPFDPSAHTNYNRIWKPPGAN